MTTNHEGSEPVFSFDPKVYYPKGITQTRYADDDVEHFGVEHFQGPKAQKAEATPESTDKLGDLATSETVERER